jgi:hypothetical protein
LSRASRKLDPLFRPDGLNHGLQGYRPAELRAAGKQGWRVAVEHRPRRHEQRGKQRRFIVHADEKLSAFVELERQVLTVTFYLASIHAGDQWR